MDQLTTGTVVVRIRVLALTDIRCQAKASRREPVVKP